MPKFTKVLSILILLALLLFGLLRADYIFMMVVGFLLATLFVLSYLKLSFPIFYYLHPFLALFYIAGTIFGFYEAGTEYDAVLHFISGFVISALFGSIILQKTKINNDKSFFVLLIIAFGLAIGVGWEIFEWVAGQYFPKNLVGDIDDTTSDLIADMLGTVLAIFSLIKYPKFFSLSSNHNTRS